MLGVKDTLSKEKNQRNLVDVWGLNSEIDSTETQKEENSGGSPSWWDEAALACEDIMVATGSAQVLCVLWHPTE